MFSIFWPLRLLTGTLKLLFNLAVLASCILTIVAMMSDRDWLWSLAAHFRAQYLAVQVIALILTGASFLNQKEPGLKRLEHAISLLALSAFAALNLAVILPYYWPPASPPSPPPQHTYKLMHFNVFSKVNKDTEKVAQAIREADPDLLDFVEYTKYWKNGLEKTGVLKRYPYRYLTYEHLGLGLYSKYPLQNTRVTFADPARPITHFANIVAQVKLHGRPVTILVTHPASPVSPIRQKWLSTCATYWIAERHKAGKHFILVGDLNTSPWSVEFSHLVQQTDLRDSQLGFGLQPSWPMLLPKLGIRKEPNLLTQLARTPIDHALVSPEIKVLSRSTGPFVGSDHLPLLMEFTLQPPAKH